MPRAAAAADDLSRLANRGARRSTEAFRPSFEAERSDPSPSGSESPSHGGSQGIGLARPVQLALGIAAAAMGSVHLKDALAPGRGPSLGIPESARPGIYARVRRVLYAENLAGALAAVALLALIVNAVELLCSAGLPALYTRVLTFHELSAPRYYAYLALYAAAYVFDDALVLAAATTLGGGKLQERQGRWLNAASGALLVVLGALVALRPGWLGRIGG